MITHSSFKNNEYLSFICSLVERLQKKGEIVYLLNHEGIGDKQICDTIKKSLNIDIPILTGLGATEVKNVIGNAKLVVSSRFHGVVSGIVQRVPTFCTSWSHKYNELLSVYGLDNNLLEIDSLDQSIEKLGDSLSNPDKYITKLEIVNQEIEST